jgi:hypothetical protein
MPPVTAPATASPLDVATLPVTDQFTTDEEETIAETPPIVPAAPPPPPPAVSTPPDPTPPPPIPEARPAPAVTTQKPYVASTAAGGTYDQLQTPFVELGETLAIDLIITPLRPDETRDYPFHVISWPAEQAGAEPVVAQSQIHVEGVPIIQRVLPFLFSFLVIIVAAGLIGAIAFLIISWNISA